MSEPRVGIFTPVYNGEAYLEQCISSVLAQRYSNWRYLILDNCSTDRSLEIARLFAAKDSRITVVSNEQFLPVIANHNQAISKIDTEAVYCKPLMADDWLFEDCIEKMVAVAEQSPTIGLVSCYATDGANVLWDGLPLQRMPIEGREICRSRLLGGPYVFGSPSSMLIRAELVRRKRPFYNQDNLHADVEACFDLLSNCNFGFAYQVLVFNRIHTESVTTAVSGIRSIEAGTFRMFCKFGKVYLTPTEFREHLRWRVRRYYRMLAMESCKKQDQEFWGFHARVFKESGLKFSRFRLASAVLQQVAAFICNPVKILKWVSHRAG